MSSIFSQPPNELIMKIIKMNTDREIEENRSKYNIIVNHLGVYFENSFNYVSPSPSCFRDGIIRHDAALLEYHDLWGNKEVYNNICNRHGGEKEFNEWCDDWF